MTDTVLFLHAFPLCRDMWRDQIEVVELAGMRAIAHNLPGFGGEAGAITSMEDAARWILDRLPPTPVHAVGLSMGGYILFELLRQAPERFDRLVFADTTARPDTKERRRDREERAKRASVEGVGFLIPEVQALHTAAVNERVAGMIYHATREGVAGALRGMAARPDSRPDLAFVKKPAMVIVGSEDSVTPPEHAHEIASALGTHARVIQGAGHFSNLDDPEAFNNALLEFLPS